MSDLANFTPRKFRWQYLVLIVIAVALVAMMILAVGNGGPDQGRQRTLVPLRLLHAAMNEYVGEGNAEPKVLSPWIYGEVGKPPPQAYAETVPASDPVQWVVALKGSEKSSKLLGGITFTTDENVPKRRGYAGVNDVLLDEWGTPIRYVPSVSRGELGYFMSAGPDGRFSMMVPAPAEALRADEIFSTDPG